MDPQQRSQALRISSRFLPACPKGAYRPQRLARTPQIPLGCSPHHRPSPLSREQAHRHSKTPSQEARRPRKAWHLPASYQRRRNKATSPMADRGIDSSRCVCQVHGPIAGHIRDNPMGSDQSWRRRRAGSMDRALEGPWLVAKRVGVELAYLYTHENPERVSGGLNSRFPPLSLPRIVQLSTNVQPTPRRRRGRC